MLKKQFIAGFIAGTLIFGTTGVYAANKISAVKTGITINYYGKEIKPAVYNINGGSYVHIRGLFEALEESVTWNPKENKFIIGEEEMDEETASENERLFAANHRMHVSAVSMYICEYIKYPKNNQDVSEYLPNGGIDMKPDGATYTVENGTVTSVYLKHRDPDKRIIVFNF